MCQLFGQFTFTLLNFLQNLRFFVSIFCWQDGYQPRIEPSEVAAEQEEEEVPGKDEDFDQGRRRIT